MIVAPPFDTGVVKATVNWAALPVTELIVGAPATVNGTPDIAALATPLPAEFTARTITSYVVPFTKALVVSERSVIMTGVDVVAGLNAFHVEPLSVEYS